MPFTLRNLKWDLQESALSYQRLPPGYRFPYGHTHKTQEEVYVVLRGTGRMKVDDEIVELREMGRGARPARYVARLRGRASGS